MAVLRRSMTHVHDKLSSDTTYTVPLLASTGGATLAAQAGAKLVIVSTGGSQATIRLTDGSGTAATRRPQALGAVDASLYDVVAAGGETQLHVTLAGAENVSLHVFESSDFGAYVGGSSNGSGSPSSTATNLHSKPSTAVSVSTAAVGIALWCTPTATQTGAASRWRQMGPRGQLVVSQGHAATGTQYVWAAGIADVTATGRWPVANNAGDYQLTSMWIAGGTDTYCVQGFYADASGVPTVAAAANDVAAENSLPGDLMSNWYLGTNGTSDGIAGYFGACSYAPGQTVAAKVHSAGQAWTMSIQRLGWCGWETAGARTVAAPIAGTVVAQPAPTVDSTLGSTSCAWTTNATWTIPSGMPSGIYHALWRRTDDPTKVAAGHFVVRPPVGASLAGKVVVVVPDCSYQAYNQWGLPGDQGPRFSPGVWRGRSYYGHGSDPVTNDFSHRSYAVSFDRPYGCASSQPNTYLWDSDYPLVHFLESQGINLVYLSEVDLIADPTLLTGAGMVLMLGHQEYWPIEVYNAYRNAIAAGVNMLSTSSNTALWRTRFAAADTTYRTMICYKDSGSVDVSPGFDGGTGRDPASYTGTWRDARPALANPDVRNERALTGQQFVFSAPIAEFHTVPFAAKHYPLWRNSSSIQALIGGQTYTTKKATVGDELDAPDGGSDQPTNMVNMSPTQITLNSGANNQGTIYTTTATVVAGLTMYRAESGALVATTGSWRYWRTTSRWALSALADLSDSNALDPNWQHALGALLHDLGAPSATPRAVRPDVDPAVTNPAVGAPTGDRDAIALAYGLQVPSDKGRFFLFF
nr:hypothetical protein [Actinomycetota bacterium]